MRSNNLPIVVLAGGKRARIRTYNTKTPNPVLSFPVELLLVGSEQQ